MLPATEGGTAGPADGATHELAGFIAGLRADDVPAEIVDVLRAACYDAIGCGLHGLTTEAGRIVRDFALEQGGPNETTMWASDGRRLSATNAALAMGTAIHGFDFDDHSRAKIHPGAVVLPTVLALGEREGASGATILAAMAAGYETMNRVSYAANPSAARMRGWHLTGTCGTFAAAAAASVILGFDRDTTASALGLAGTQSSGLWAFNADGAMSKRLHPGRAAQSGIMAALLAVRGFVGPRYILETEDGGFLQAMSDKFDTGAIGDDLGGTWWTAATCFKPYSCCGSNHGAVGATLMLRSAHNLTPDDVERIVVGVARVVDRQTGFPYSRSTQLNAQMSIRYDVAVALADGQVLLEQFSTERMSDPALERLIAKVEVRVDPEMDAIYPSRYAGVVTIHTIDGRRLHQRLDYSKGMPENPMSLTEIRHKFESLCAAATEEGATAQLGEAIDGMFRDGVSALADVLGRMVVRPPYEPR